MKKGTVWACLQFFDYPTAESSSAHLDLQTLMCQTHSARKRARFYWHHVLISGSFDLSGSLSRLDFLLYTSLVYWLSAHKYGEQLLAEGAPSFFSGQATSHYHHVPWIAPSLLSLAATRRKPRASLSKFGEWEVKGCSQGKLQLTLQGKACGTFM